MRALLDSLDTAICLQPARCAIPVDRAFYELVHDRNDIVDGTDQLRGGISFAERNRAILQGCGKLISALPVHVCRLSRLTGKVNGTAKWRTEFIVPSVFLADGSTRIVHSARDTNTPQFPGYFDQCVTGSVH